MSIQNRIAATDFFGTNGSEKSWTEKCLFALCIVSAVLMFVRCCFGVEFTDEAYCVSDPLTIMHGNTPYAFAASMIAGQSFVPILFYRLYELFVPDLEGIFLYSRLCYVLFRLGILIGIYQLLRRELARKYRLLLLLAMIPFMGSVIQNFTYNTVAAYCTLLVSVLLYTAQKDNGKTAYCKLVLSGVFSAVSVFAHPVSALAVIINFVLILMGGGKKDRFYRLAAYCAGGIVVIFLVVIPIVLEVGFDKLIYGIESFLYYRPHMAKDSTVSRIIVASKTIAPHLGVFVAAVGCFAGLLAVLARKGRLQIGREERNWLVLGLSLCAALAITLIRVKGVNFLYLSGVLFLTTTVLAIFVCNMRHSMTWYVLLPNISYVAFLILFTRTGVPRFYYCIPLLLLVLFTMFRSASRAVRGTAAVLAILFSLLQGYMDYAFVYRDAALPLLNTRVEQGVYKGIYTTSDRAGDVVELEAFLSENIAPEESVSFRDNAPAAYLMRSKNICDVRTWDEMQYSYGCNDPLSMYRYYKNVEAIPDVIAYIDFGRDSVLSIDQKTDAFQYNDFVNKYYDLSESVLENQTFRVRLYRSNKTFRNEFDELIESVK